MRRALWVVGSFELRRGVGGDRNDRETEKDRKTKRYQVSHRCASRVAAFLDHRLRHQTFNVGNLPSEYQNFSKPSRSRTFSRYALSINSCDISSAGLSFN